VNDDHELRPVDNLSHEDKQPLLKAGKSNDSEAAKRWKSAASDSSRIPQSLAQAYNGNDPRGAEAPPPAQKVSESFKTRTNQASTVQTSYILLVVVVLLCIATFFGKFVFKVF
jgi:hypothetical protein